MERTGKEKKKKEKKRKNKSKGFIQTQYIQLICRQMFF